jgi:hypothetical protein
MKSRRALLTAVMALAHVSAWAQTPTPANKPIIYSGLFAIRSDGSSSGFASQTGEYVGADLAGTLYLSPCSGMGASSVGREVSAFATDIWFMSGRVLELTDQYASLQVGWRRTRRNGQNETSPEQSVTLTLKRGERHNLETISVPATGSCEARTASLGVVFGSRQEITGITPEAYRGGSVGAKSGYVQGSLWRDGRPVPPSGGGVTSPALERLTADLWLVRSTPGQPDETQYLASQLIPIPVAYSFPPVTIQTAAGPIMIKVEGTLEAGLSPDGQRRFHFVAGRTITASTSSRPARDVKPLVEGSNKVTFAMPEGDEVLAFEMPPLRTPDGTTLPDRLSIRVRISRSPVR